MVRSIVALVFTVGLLAGCASTKPLVVSDDTVGMLSGKSLVSSARAATPPFGAMTPGRAVFGLIGAMVALNAGNNLIKDNGVQDPAGYIAASLGQELASKYNLKINDAGTPTIGASVDELASEYSESDLVMDVQTTGWSFSHYPMSWGTYRVIYTANLKLIDTKSKAVLAEGQCHYAPDKQDNSPSYDELVGNSASRLKEEVQVAAEHCISSFRSEVLAL